MKVYMQFYPDYGEKSIVPKISFRNDEGNMDYSHLTFKSFNFEWMGTMTRLILAHREGYYEIVRFCSILTQLWNGDKTDRKTKQKGLVERFPEVIRKTDNNSDS